MTLPQAVERVRLPLYYTFGNHMHWVDMQWLWGYSVLPDSVRDMIRFCEETGAKGNINFEGIGYEKMAAEAPEALAELRAAVARGQIEVVGASYGQPYGLFHGGESNVRQRIYGVRAVMRLLGARPRTFWEEEFDFFPQLPQMLRGVGFRCASLFFQWTWHTPELPRETLPAIEWEGINGSRLLAAPRSALNLHQWPEDFAGLLESPLLREMPTPGIVQWLELMPSPDWMCRSELLLPQLKALMADERFELRFVTLSEYLELARAHAQPRRYTLDDVFHGMSLGKNGDLFRRFSRRAEESLLAAEAVSALAGLFGRPYPHWDVYPTWELEEAWRELLSAQHHDNDECEGLCGHVGRFSYERSLSLSGHVNQRSVQLLADRVAAPGPRTLAFNPLGWERAAVLPHPQTSVPTRWMLPPFGYRLLDDGGEAVPAPAIEEDAAVVTLRRGALTVTVDKARGVISQIASAEFPQGVLAAEAPLGGLSMTRREQVDHFETAVVTAHAGAIHITREGREGARVTITVALAPELDAVDITYATEGLPRPDPWLRAALATELRFALPGARLIHDHPYGVSAIRAEGRYLRKYPTGEWMTSPQVFEEVVNPFTALSLLDFDAGDRGVLLLHDGSQAFQRLDGEALAVRSILSMYDAWDEDYFVDTLEARFRLVPHGAIDHAARWRLAQEFRRLPLAASSARPGGALPAQFGPVWCDAPNVVVAAFYREQAVVGAGLDDYAGAAMAFPYILRLVELNGQPATARLLLPGAVAAAYRTNLLGEVESAIAFEAAAPGEAAARQPLATWSSATIALRPHEIATLYIDLEMGRKQPRNLDEFRYVWATVHRVDEIDEKDDRES